MDITNSSLADFPFKSIYECLHSGLNISIVSAFFVVYILLLALPVLVLYLGCQRWRTRRSRPPGHSDAIAYHAAIMQLSELFGLVMFLVGANMFLRSMMLAGTWIWVVTSLGQSLLHLLTCVERYLAVVHPVTYRGLRQAAGVRIRNASIGGVWFLSFGCLASTATASFQFNMVFFLCIKVFFLVAVSFFSIWVLCSLKRPGPGDGGGDREQGDRSKEKAFRTIMGIMGVLLFRFGGDVVATVIYGSSALRFADRCLVFISLIWIELPSFLVLPLLFLNRVGKLPCAQQNTVR